MPVRVLAPTDETMTQLDERKAQIEQIISASWKAGYEAGAAGIDVEMHIVWDGLKPRIEYRPS